MTAIGSTGHRLATTLATCAAEQASGIVKAEHGKLRRLFCVEKGWLAFAVSNLIEEQFVDVLERSGVIRIEDRIAVVDAATRSKTKAVKIILDRNLAPPDALRTAMESHIGALLSACLEWPDGRIEFTPGQARLEGEVTARVSPVLLIVNHARGHPASIDLLEQEISHSSLKPVRSQRLGKVVEFLQQNEAGAFLLARADGTLTLGELASLCPGDREPVLRMLDALLLVGALEPAGQPWEQPAIGAAVAEPSFERNEVLAILGRAYGADHYAVLGLDRRASAEQIREAYYALARRYHPDRFRSGPLQDLLGKIEVFFTQVTEAYNTLSSAEKKAEYDQGLGHVAARSEATGPSDAAYLARQNFLRGKSLAEKKRFPEAATFLENAVKLDASQPEYHLELGRLLTRFPRRKAEAERSLLTCTELDPSQIEAYLALGRFYQRGGRTEDAILMFREVLRWEPGHVEAASLLAELGASAQPSPEGRVRRGLFKG